jgi:hypothetical protein
VGFGLRPENIGDVGSVESMESLDAENLISKRFCITSRALLMALS